MPKKKLSEMKTESEEARWFEENQDYLLKLFEQAEKDGTLRVGGKSIGITLCFESQLAMSSGHGGKRPTRGWDTKRTLS